VESLTLTELLPTDWIADVNAVGDTFLIAPRGIRIVDRSGAEVAKLPAFPELRASVEDAVFLADGMVAIATRHSIGVWDPETDAVGAVNSPAWLDEPTLSAVGSRVVAANLDGRAALLDPLTGRQIGEHWVPGETWSVAASPDGSRFVAAVHDRDIRGPLEIRDAATGAVLAVNDGQELSHVTSVSWLTDQVILVMRASTGTEVIAEPELYLADALSAQAVPLQPLVDVEWFFATHGSVTLAVDSTGDVLLMRARESSATD
jgi:hypothetical protein